MGRVSLWGGVEQPRWAGGSEVSGRGGGGRRNVQVPEAPTSPGPAEEPRAGARGPPFPPGARWWVSKGDTGSGHPQGALTAWEGCRDQVPSSSWKVGCPPSSPLPVFLGGHPPNLTHPSTHGGRQSARAPLQPTPCSPDEGARGAMGGAVEVKSQIHSLRKKSENPKKKKNHDKTMCR